MYRKILVGGVTAAAILGAGGAALAAGGSPGSTAGAPAASATSAASTSTAAQRQQRTHHQQREHRQRMGRRRLLRHLAHGQIVTRNRKGFVTHDLIRGTVTSVSATSVTVRAADSTSETFAITKDTKVRVRQHGTRSDSSIEKVAKGDKVAVAGTGATTLTARRLIDIRK